MWPRSLDFTRGEDDESRAPSAGRRRGIAEVEHVRALRQRAPHFRAAHALPAAVHDAHLEPAAPPALVEVFLHHAHRVAGRERVQVQLARDGKDERLGGRAVVAGVRHRALAAAATKYAGRYSESPSSSRL